MKLKTLLFASLSSLFVLAWMGARPVVAQDDEEESVLHVAMETLMGNFMPLRRAIGAEDGATGLGHVVAMQAAVLSAKGETPPLTGEQAEDEQAAYVRDYRTSMIDLMDQLLDLERALLAEEWESANELMREGLVGVRDSGHERFKPRGR